MQYFYMKIKDRMLLFNELIHFKPVINFDLLQINLRLH